MNGTTRRPAIKAPLIAPHSPPTATPSTSATGKTSFHSRSESGKLGSTFLTNMRDADRHQRDGRADREVDPAGDHDDRHAQRGGADDHRLHGDRPPVVDA